MKIGGLVAVLAAVLMAGCVSVPDTFAPPMQRKPLAGPDESHLKHYVTMNDPHAMEHVLADVRETLEGGTWRWTAQRPAFRFALNSTAHLRLSADFSIAGATLQQTGPVTITYSVNGKVLDKVTYDTEGSKHFEKAVEESWLKKGPDNIVTLLLDKVMQQSDGTKLGITLSRIGFLD